MSKEITKTDKQEIQVVDGEFWLDVFHDLNLTFKQQAFVRAHVTTGGKSATAAVQKAYNSSSENSAAVMAHNLLRLPKIQRAIDRAMEVAEITPEWIKKEIKTIAKDEEVPAHTRLNALSNLGKAEGMYVEKKLIGVVGSIQVNWD